MKDTFNKNFNISYLIAFFVFVFSIFLSAGDIEKYSPLNTFIALALFAMLLYPIVKHIFISLYAEQRQINLLMKVNEISRKEAKNILSVYFKHSYEFLNLKFNTFKPKKTFDENTKFEEFKVHNDMANILNILKIERLRNFKNWKDPKVNKYIKEHKFLYKLFKNK